MGVSENFRGLKRFTSKPLKFSERHKTKEKGGESMLFF